MSPDNIHKILLLRFSSLGDIVMTTAMIRCVRQAFPGAQIDMVVRQDFLDLIRHNPHLDQKIGLPRGEGLAGLQGLLTRLNRERYDLIYDAHRSLRTGYLMPLLKAGHKIYYRKHYLRRSAALTFKLPLLRDKSRMLSRFIEPLEPFGVRYDGRGPEVFLSEPSRQRAWNKLPGSHKLAGEQATVGLIPSAQWTGKRWPLPYFRELLSTALQRTDYRFIVFGGPQDRFCEDLCFGLPEHRVFNAQGKLSLEEAACLLAECRLVVANDTGLMHVADALGVPSVLFLGPTSAELGCLPYHPHSEILEQELWCRPCSKNGQAPCIRRRRYCLERTTPDEAFAALQTVMTRQRELGS